jgi:hypothetical protein
MTEEVPAISNSLKDCDQQITPDCLRALYALQDYTPSVGGQNSFGIGMSTSFMHFMLLT